MRNCLCWSFALGYNPKARLLRCRYQHVGIQKLSRTQHEPLQTQREAPLTQCEPPQTQHGPNGSRWNIGRLGPFALVLALTMYISCCLCQFHSRWVAKASAFSGGI